MRDPEVTRLASTLHVEIEIDQFLGAGQMDTEQSAINLLKSDWMKNHDERVRKAALAERDKSLFSIEEALTAYFQSTFDDDTNESRRSAVIIDWIVGYTVSNIVDVDGKQVVGFHNEYMSPDTNPNSQAYLARWVSDELDEILHGRRIEDDD